jgi:hypothetical protein
VNRVATAFGWARRIAMGVFMGATGDWAEPEPETPWNGSLKRIAAPPVQRELPGLLIDPDHMRAVFERELPLLADRKLHVTRCSARSGSWRKSGARGRCNVVYDVGIVVDGEPEREIVILGMAPSTKEIRASMEERCRLLRDHPWTAPFREPALHLESLSLMVLFSPLDPFLPGLADVTGREGARVLSRALQASCGEDGIERIDCELVHYKPFDRAVVKVRATLRDASADPLTVYAKFFAKDELESCREYEALWSATRRATWLRLPEPLAYDPARHMLLMSEVEGEAGLNKWIKRLEAKEPLPRGVDLERLELCVVVAARALGELQRSGIRLETRRTFRDDLERLEKDRDLLRDGARSFWPELVACADGLIERMEALAPAQERLVPAHGAYRHKQMIGDERSLTVIDWDGLSLANHALDAATFLGRLRREMILPDAAPELQRMVETFRNAFLEQEPAAARDLDLYESLLLTDELLRALRRRGDAQETALEVHRLAEAAGRLLERIEGRNATDCA